MYKKSKAHLWNKENLIKIFEKTGLMTNQKIVFTVEALVSAASVLSLAY